MAARLMLTLNAFEVGKLQVAFVGFVEAQINKFHHVFALIL